MAIGAKFAGGNSKDGRQQEDFYPTPIEATLAIIPILKSRWGVEKTILEPCCGDGAMAEPLKAAGFDVFASDLVDRGYGVQRDFFSVAAAPDCGLVTNPPFNIAENVIRHAKEIGIERMALILKMTYWNTAKRQALWQFWTPSLVLPLTWRLDFLGKGAAVMDCMWCVWDQSRVCEFLPLGKPKK